MRGFVVLLALAGCNRLLGVNDFPVVDDARGDGTSADDAVVVDGPLPPDAVCLGTLLEFCKPTAPANTVVITTAFDTDDDCTDTQPQNNHPLVCVLFAKTITFSGRVKGTRPLMLVATEDLTLGSLAEDVDVSGDFNNLQSPPACANTTPGGSTIDGGDGGHGGTFGSRGGNGGPGGGTQVVAPLPTSSGVPGIRGGCAGSRGGDGSDDTTGGKPGNPGNAIYAVAGRNLIVNGNVFAAGMPGFGGFGPSLTGSGGGGGGGGGSGGLIALEAGALDPLGEIRLGGILAANGAGGGGGAGKQPMAAGKVGKAGTTETFNEAAAGGDGGTPEGGRGGAGCNGGNPGEEGQQQVMVGGGGGGGGGGCGFVYLKGTVVDTAARRISPPPVLVP